jgi:flavin-dependent dehydrogenase
VIGAGVSGLSAAGALAGSFEEAIVLERTSCPPAHTQPGVPQEN